LDDLQWAGADVLALLAMLVRTAGSQLRIAGAYRPSEAGGDTPLGELLAELAPAGLARHLALGPLAAEEAAVLLDSLLAEVAPAPPARESVLRRCGGVPFFLVSSAAALASGAPVAGTTVPGVPWDVAVALRQRVAALPAGAR